ncbi:SGNH/GDSL hydrolase family protein [Zunongwangia sp.]|uniref:SGNH/GDSL hydrolase family protein n=1 Tax=Zunongwangia sp. TaxID=1965325 RepID=UPI003AA89B6A
MKLFYSFLLLIAFAVISISCGSGRTVSQSNKEMDTNAEFSYLALGDSYTIGESVTYSQSWPVQLTENLRADGYRMAAPKIIANTGWTTADLIAAVNSEINVQRDFDIVSILIGVNNQYQNKPLSEFEEELHEIFRKAINHCKTMEKGVFVLSIPDYRVTPFGMAHSDKMGRDIDAFNDVIRQVASEFNVDFYNITPISRKAKNNSDLIAVDDLHPSELMYKYWVDAIVDNVRNKLPNK